MKLVVIDSNYICHRVRHTMKGLSFKGLPTNIIFGFLKEIKTLSELFDTDNLIFAWDYGKNIRKEIYKEYKGNRKKELTEEEKLEFDNFKLQTNEIRENILDILGYRSNFYQDGYESDDIIASICNSNINDEIIIVSADADLFQLISENISMYDPHKKSMQTLQTFTDAYGISPSDWVFLKAIAGCSSDNIIGIKGVGEKTALKYLKNQLDYKSKAYIKIAESQDLIVANLNLVSLPYEGTKTFKIKENSLKREEWNKLADVFGMKSLRDNFPKGF